MPNHQQPQPLRAGILHVAGADAMTFAQAQLASNLSLLQAGHWQWTSWLDASGKVQYLALAWRDRQALHLLLRGGSANKLREALQRYTLRARVTLDCGQDQLLHTGPATPEGSMIHDQSGLHFGMGSFSLSASPIDFEPARESLTDAVVQSIRAGHPWLPDSCRGELLPPALHLYALGAVALGKGCYPGQEMVNRLHVRGGHKYRLAHINTRSNPIPGSCWDAGATLVADQQAIGRVLLHAGDDALVVMRLQALESLPASNVVTQFPV